MKRFLKKLLSLLILLGIGFFLYHNYRPWIKRQIMKVKGVYYIYKGDQAYSQDNMARTLEYYKKGLQLYPKHHEAWYNLGNIYTVYEDYSSAVEAYQNAIKYHPKFVMARMNLGIVYSEDLGFFDEAIDQFDEITQINPIKLWFPFVYSNVKSIRANKGIAYYNKGVAFKRKAMFLPLEKKHLLHQFLGDAIDAYTDATKFLKNNYDVYYNRAVAHHLRGEYNDAGLDYCKAIKIEPMKFEAHYNLAVLLRYTKHYKESAKELEKAALLITESGDDSGLQTAYIFNLLNDVSRKFMSSSEYGTQKLTDEPSGSISYTSVGGKIVSEDEFDKAMIKNFKTCSGYDTFKKGNNIIEEEY